MNLLQIVGGLLIDVVVEPVGEQQVAVAAPGDARGQGRVVVRVVVLGLVDGQAFLEVAAVFRVQRHGRILRVPRDEYLTPSASHHHAHAAPRAFGDESQFRVGKDVLATEFGVAAVRHVELVVETAEDGQSWVENALREDAKHLLPERVLGHAVVVVEASLRRPADVERAGDVRAAPVEDFRQFVPVAHLFVFHLLKWCAGDDETVELLLSHFLEVAVEGPHVFHGRVLARVGLHLHQVNLQLEGRVGQDAHEVRFGRYLQRHQVQNGNAQRAYVLVAGSFGAHDEDVLLFQQLNGRQSVG